MKAPRTAADVKNDLQRRGVSLAAHCRRLKIDEQTARDLLAGKAKGLRGKAHRAAVLLGLKVGVVERAAR
ncbi:DNA-binding protein [Roseateles sp. DXS20W]|uniref:DNA-binding protein n=1 Tax=Pelomonas lactea TaxID=3299030 RepID=A0ABW7GK97_9BURK